MDYRGLPVYTGPRTACDRCGRPFCPGETISVSDGGALAFCHTPGNTGCLIDYIIHELPVGPRTLVGNHPHVYLEYTDAGNNAGTEQKAPAPLVERIKRLFIDSTD